MPKKNKNRKKIRDKQSQLSPKNKLKDKSPRNEDIHFSFKHANLMHKKFSIEKQPATYFYKLFNRLKSLSGMKAKDFLSNRSQSLRSHVIQWNNTSEPNGFNLLEPQLRDCTPYQFTISKDAHGRVHGFMLGNIFYIVWFDPGHKLYARK